MIRPSDPDKPIGKVFMYYIFINYKFIQQHLRYCATMFYVINMQLQVYILTARNGRLIGNIVSNISLRKFVIMMLILLHYKFIN